MMKKLLITTKLSEKNIEILKKHFDISIFPAMPKEEIIKIIPEHEVLFVRSETHVDKEIIHAGKNLKIIGRAGTGVDNIDLESAKMQGITVMNTPNTNSRAVAELVFGIMLSWYRHLRDADLSMKQGTWDKKKFTGHELHGKTLAIIGLGNIGKIVAQIGKAFGMNLIGFDTFLTQAQFIEIGVEKENTLSDLLSKADVLTIHIPKTPETTHLIGARELKLMKKTSMIINCSRGGIIDEKSLLQALKEGIIGGAGIDTWEMEPQFNQELAAQHTVVAIPHLGASTDEAQEKCVFDLIDQIFKFYGWNLS